MASTDAVVAVATLKAVKGKEDQVAEALRKAAQDSRKDEGCMVYEIHVDLNDASTFTIYERWASEQALRAHIKAAHSQTMFARLKQITDGSGAKIERLRPLL
jgi:quinol monooxygenase YgiN